VRLTDSIYVCHSTRLLDLHGGIRSSAGARSALVWLGLNQ
jgi:hypothetical protein